MERDSVTVNCVIFYLIKKINKVYYIVALLKTAIITK